MGHHVQHAIIAEPCVVRGHGGDVIEAYYARPLTSARVPSVVFLHHSPGFDDWCKEAIRNIATRGYAVLGPDLFSRAGPGEWDDVAAAARARLGGNGMPDDQVLGDIEGTVAFLRSQPITNGKVGAIGLCSGGRQAYWAACKLSGLDAIVDAWGGNVYPEPERRKGDTAYAADFTEHLSCPILGIFGNEDSSPSQAEVDHTEELLKRLNKPYEFHRYDGAGHAFFCADRPPYRVAQAVDGWQKVFAFFDTYLASSAEPDWATRR